MEGSGEQFADTVFNLQQMKLKPYYRLLATGELPRPSDELYTSNLGWQLWRGYNPRSVTPSMCIRRRLSLIPTLICQFVDWLDFNHNNKR